MTHPIWQLKVNKTDDEAALILTPCPGTKGVSLRDSLMQLKEQGAEAIVTALTMDEMVSKDVQQLEEVSRSLAMKWFHLPIEDDRAPESDFATKWNAVSSELHAILDNNGKVVMHCMGGSGRTGLLAAHLLLEKGWEIDSIVNEVQALRPGAYTKPVQVEYLETLRDK